MIGCIVYVSSTGEVLIFFLAPSSSMASRSRLSVGMCGRKSAFCPGYAELTTGIAAFSLSFGVTLVESRCVQRSCEYRLPSGFTWITKHKSFFSFRLRQGWVRKSVASDHKPAAVTWSGDRHPTRQACHEPSCFARAWSICAQSGSRNNHHPVSIPSFHNSTVFLLVT